MKASVYLRDSMTQTLNSVMRGFALRSIFSINLMIWKIDRCIRNLGKPEVENRLILE